MARFRLPIFLAVIATFSLGSYLWLSSRYSDFGFPLDDAWIHQTYARNLVERGEWSFTPGQPSAGSTSPLWSAILAIGYLFKIRPTSWAYFLGWILLWLGATLAVYGLKLCPQKDRLGDFGWDSYAFRVSPGLGRSFWDGNAPVCNFGYELFNLAEQTNCRLVCNGLMGWPECLGPPRWNYPNGTSIDGSHIGRYSLERAPD